MFFKMLPLLDLAPIVATIIGTLVCGTVLGLKGSGNFSADERPKNYRETILLLFPNASAPLTALLSKLKNEPTDDAEFKIFLKTLPSQRAALTGTHDNAVTTLNLATAGDEKKFKKGHAIMNERTLEVMWVSADPSVSAQVPVTRGKGSTAASMTAQDFVLIIGSHHPEGAAVPSAIAYDPQVVSNYCQIFRNTLDMTNTAKQTHLRTGDNMKEAKRECLELHSIEMEKGFLFGTGVEDTSGSQPERTTKGLLSVLSTNVKDFQGSVSIDGWENFLEGIFTSGSSNKLILCGARALNVFNKLARVHHTIEATPKTDTYGSAMTTWLTPYGEVQLKNHPLLSDNPTFTSWGFVIDTQRIVYRYLRGRDTQYLEGRQNNGDDATKNEFLTECGLEFQFEQAHGVFKNASAFQA